MNARRMVCWIVLVALVSAGLACSEADKRSSQIDYVRSKLNHEQREISGVIYSFFSHLLRLEIDKANLLITKTSPMRFEAEDHAKWNEEVGRNEKKKQEIRDVLNDSKLYWDLIEVDPGGRAMFRYPPDPSAKLYDVNSYGSVQLLREGDKWKINTWNYGK